MFQNWEELTESVARPCKVWQLEPGKFCVWEKKKSPVSTSGSLKTSIGLLFRRAITPRVTG